ncbi:MAG: protoheme IX farnesyltransferase [Acidimicrobiia bacterium]|nr:protoheme IX farnesyltransferase [Acidimicrobiia bacterium]
MTGSAMEALPAIPVGQKVAALVRLTKPRIIELLLVTTLPAMMLAARGWPGTSLVVATLIGGTLSAGGANALNNYVDRDVDMLMRRTSKRPLPTHTLTPAVALVVGIGLGVAGFVVLWATSNLLAAMISTGALLFYVFVYTLVLKRRTVQNIVIGGAAGAAPALVGWAAVTGSLSAGAWVLFAIVFMWTPPHFWALALKYKEDYERAGIPMLPAERGEAATLQAIVRYTVGMVLISFVLVIDDAIGVIYVVLAAVLGAWFLSEVSRLRTDPGRAMIVFARSNLYLTLLFGAAALDAVVS